MSTSLAKFRLPNSTSKTPIVYLLGWGGSKIPQLDKYSKIYEENGCDVTRYISPFGKSSGRSFKSYEPFAQDFYNRALIDLKKDTERPIIFHTFSMNGISLLTKVWDLLSEQDAQLKSRVKGVVFDSGPSDLDARNSAIAFAIATFPSNAGFVNSVGRALTWIYVYSYVGFFRSLRWFRYLTYDPQVLDKEVCYYRLLKIKDLPANQLYLYSTIDSMIKYNEVDQFIDHQKSLGAKIDSKRWDDSPHVQHLRFHPKEYRQLCDDFLKKALEK